MTTAVKESLRNPAGSVKGIVRSGVASSVGNAIVNFSNIGRDASIALAFGTGMMVDAFFLAIMFPIFIMTVGASAYRSTMIPILEKTIHVEGVVGVQKMIGRFMAVNAPIVLGAGIILALCAPFYAPLISGNLPGDAATSIRLFTWAALPMFVVSAYANLAEGPLQTQGVFFLSSLMRAGLPLGMTFGAIFLGPQHGILGLCYGGLIGAVLQLIVASILLAQQGMLQGVRTPLKQGLGGEVRGQFALLSAGVSLSYISPLIDQWMASFLDAGSVSILSYANRLVVGAASLSIGALGPALLPHFSKLVARGDNIGLNKHYVAVIRLTLWASVAIAGVIWLLSEPIVVLLYERGNFSRTDSLAVANIIGWLCLQFPALLIGIVASIVLSAVSLNKVFIPLSILVACVNVAANFILMQWYGLVGIAISTAVTYVVSLVTMNIVLYRKKIVRLPQTLFIDLVASAGMAVILALVLTAIDGKPGPIPTGRQIALSTLGVGIYCLIAYLCARPTLAGIKGNTRNA